MTEARRTAFSRGVDAESVAARFLEAQGFALVAQRVRTPRGELDLVMRRDTLLVFCEVKARARLEAAAESLQLRQRRRIAEAAEIFLARHPEFDGFDIRLDVVLVVPGRAPVHLPAAFETD